jgi:hypothetical protein
MALKIDIGNVEKISFYIPIYDNTQFILQSLIVVPMILLYFFSKNDLDKGILDFDKLVLFIVSYGSSFLLMLFALAIVAIALVYSKR